jgi:cellulose synthase/poly-beta-1,6-N-acetylglucosamine synthase-like glycosyltransferase
MIFDMNLLLLLMALAVSVPVAIVCLEVLLSVLPRRLNDLPQAPRLVRLTVLIPAHNEQSVIESTLLTLLPTVPLGSRVLVVADNCTDLTATIAREGGAEVVERTDYLHRGKGFALDFGLRHLSHDPPDAVVFLDADCRVARNTVRVLAAAAVATQRPIQGLNLCDPDKCGSVLQLVSGFAFRFKNLVRTLGLVRLAGQCYLTGTGMALPWPLIEKTKFATANVVEDMQLGIDLALAGRPPLFLPEARVDSPLPQAPSAARTQRTRWEHGHLKTLLTQSPRLLILALRHRRLGLLWLALDLAIPPLSLFALTLAATTFISAAAWLLGASVLPLFIVAAAGSVLAISVLIGWAAHCREQVPLWAILAAPAYAATKLPIYLAFLFKRQQQWIRTARDAARCMPPSTEYSLLSTKEKRPICDSRPPTPVP